MVLGTLTWTLVGLIVGTLLGVAPQPVTAEGKSSVAEPAKIAAAVPPVQSSTATELWTTGFLIEGQPAYNSVIGRILDKAVFRSYRERDIYYIFPAAGSSPTVNAARFKIASKSGSYAGETQLTLAVFDGESGEMRRAVATADDNWLAKDNGSWASMTVADTDIQIGPDEFLAFHFQLSGDVGGDLEVSPQFEVEVTQPSIDDLIEAEVISIDTVSTLTGQAALTSTQSVSSTASQLSKEIWRSGFTVEGTANYEVVQGKLADTVAAVRSTRDVSDIYYVFPATPTKLVTILSAKIYVLDKIGSYDGGDVTLTLEAHGIDESSSRVISTEIINVKQTETGEWTPIQLSVSPADVKLSTDEYLVAHFDFEDGAGGDLDLRPMFEVETAFIETDVTDKRPGALQIYVPVLSK